MKLLELWVQTPLAAALGWTLLYSLWEGVIVSSILFAVTLATRSPRMRYAAASILMLALLGGIGVTLARMLPQGADGLQVINTRMGTGPNGPARVNASPDPGVAVLVPWLAPCWIAGVWIVYMGQMAGWISLWRLRRRGVCQAAEYWRQELVRLSARLRLTRPVSLLESGLADTPVVLGHFRPLILMPVGLLSALPAGQIEAILLHELAHIRRWDYLTNVFQRLVEGLLFYHPAVWWISRVMRTERENCCDDVVVTVHGNAHEYAAALAALEHNRWPAARQSWPLREEVL
jgi:bla regulator protein BlaR1